MHYRNLISGGIFQKKRFRVAGVLILLTGAVVTRAWLAHDTDTPSDDVYIAKPLYSPDGKYMAVVFSESGGGGISPYCFDDVSVVPTSLTQAQAYARRFRVYEGACHTLGFFYPVHSLPTLLNAPLLKWSNSRELEITFDPRQAALGVNKIVLAAHNDDGLVQIKQKGFNKEHTRVAGPFVPHRMPEVLD
jgi:hypothetical protein